jgi:hypothetical protein
VACRFPNGATALATHYRARQESWPGGFHRDPKQDQELLARNPLPPATLALRDFHVNGHRITFDGELAMAFRIDEMGSLVAFAGHGCRNIIVDGREFVFASRPVSLVAWAPVLAQRRVPGGAILEIWSHGEADISLPLPSGVDRGQLYFQGMRIDAIGEKLACDCSGSLLRFKSRNRRPRNHLFFVGG